MQLHRRSVVLPTLLVAPLAVAMYAFGSSAATKDPAHREIVRPRLHLNRATVDALTVKVRSEPYATLFRELRETAEVGVVNKPPTYVRKDKTGVFQNWQRDVGNMIPELALMYLLTEDERYLNAAKAAMRASAGYPTWGLDKSDGLELAAAHQLYGLALGYDWLHDRLDGETRRIVRSCLKTRGQFMYEKLRSGEVWWSQRYLSNHLWVPITGLYAAGLALQGEENGVESWISLCQEKLRQSIAALGPDGASTEGLAYWSYGLEYLLKMMDLSRALEGEDLFHTSPWLENTASYRLYSMLPRHAWKRDVVAFNFADGPPHDYYGPDYVLRKLAAEFHDPYAQWLAQELDDANLSGSEARFLNLLWYSPEIKPKRPADLPTFKRFPDLGLVVMRSGWNGDESVLEFRCGPHLGHRALGKFSTDPGAGHFNPDAGSFLLHAFGDWLIGPEMNVRKITEFENTVRVNGVGQTMEGGDWKKSTALIQQKRGASILRAEASDRLDYVIGDVRPAYPDSAGLEKFLRHVIYVKPSCWVIVDQLRADRPSTFEWSFHSMLPFVIRKNGAFAVTGPHGSLRIDVLGRSDVEARIVPRQIVAAQGVSSNALVLSNRQKTQAVDFVSVLYVHSTASGPKLETAVASSGKHWTVRLKIDGRPVDLAIDLDRSDPAAPIVALAPSSP